MNDPVRAARDDLAFMRELAEDRGPLPSHLGQHIFWPGLLYGLNVIVTWAGLDGLVPFPADWQTWSWLPATILYVPICIWVNVTARRHPWGPSARMFAAAWSGVGFLTLVIVTVVVAASYREGINHVVVWPPLAVAIYGASWLVLGILMKRTWALLIAVGCAIGAISMSFLTNAPEFWLVMGVSLLLFLALPGFQMMRGKKSSS